MSLRLSCSERRFGACVAWKVSGLSPDLPVTFISKVPFTFAIWVHSPIALYIWPRRQAELRKKDQPPVKTLPWPTGQIYKPRKSENVRFSFWEGFSPHSFSYWITNGVFICINKNWISLRINGKEVILRSFSLQGSFLVLLNVHCLWWQLSSKCSKGTMWITLL